MLSPYLTVANKYNILLRCDLDQASASFESSSEISNGSYFPYCNVM